MSANFIPDKEDYKILTPFKMQVLTNFPYIEADFDALTNYQLLCKIVEYLNNVIHNENELTEQVNSLYNAFVSLQNYVNNYFDNLDIQTEVDNKLDEMAESGALADMIAEYIKLQGQLVYNSVSDMKLADNIQNGSFLKTYGYYNYRDGGGALYKARTITNADVIDNMTMIALKDETLVAELIMDKEVSPEMFGAYGDSIHNDSVSLQTCIDFASEKNIPILFKNKYLIKNILTLRNNLTITGKNAELIVNIADFDFDDSIFAIITENFEDYTIEKENFNHDITIKDITIRGIGVEETNTIKNIFGISNTINFTFDSCHFILEDGCRFEPFDFRGGNVNTIIKNVLYEDLQNNSTYSAGGWIFRQYNPNVLSSFKISNIKFIKENGDDVLFIHNTNNIEEFIVEDSIFEIGKNNLLANTPDNCFTIQVLSGEGTGSQKVDVYMNNCYIHAYKYNKHLFIKSDQIGSSSLTCNNCKIITETDCAGILSRGITFNNCDIDVGNNVVEEYKPNILESNIDKCNINININLDYYFMTNGSYCNNSVINGNGHTATTLMFDVKSCINNIIKNVLFESLFLDVEEIINNSVFRYAPSTYKNIIQFSTKTNCIAKDNYFDSWGIITTTTGNTTVFVNNSGYRFSLTNNGTFKNANNTALNSFVGTGWNESGNNLVL